MSAVTCAIFQNQNVINASAQNSPPSCFDRLQSPMPFMAAELL